MHNGARIAAIAGAGTGKTYSLVENYVAALLGLDGSEKKRPQEILALTFTQKAAHEMRLRITKRIADLLVDSPPHPLEVEPPSKDEIKRILRALPNAPIATFHGFCSKLLRKHARSIGIDERFVILDPTEELAIARSIVRPLILEKLAEKNTIIASLVARLRLGSNQQPGFMDSLIRLYFKVAELGIDADYLFNLTEMSKASDEMLLRAVDELAAAFRSFLSMPLTKTASERVGQAEVHFLAFKQALPSAIALEHFEKLGMALKGNFGDLAARQNLLCAVANVAALLVDQTSFAKDLAVAHLLTQFHHAFEQYKQEALCLSYGDLLVKTKQALLHNQALRKSIKNSFKHILIDEYQDTSPIQEDIIFLLLENNDEETSLDAHRSMSDQINTKNGSSLFVVGDKKQSIYGFRGAEISLFDRMISTMERDDPAFSPRLLTTNRRSQKNVLALVNLVAKATLLEQNYHDSQALQPHKSDSGRCGIFLSSEEGMDKTEANLRAAAFGLTELLAKRADLQPKDIVVLVRRIKSAAMVKELLGRFGIASRIVSSEGFFQQQEVVDVLLALKLLLDPFDSLALACVLRSPLLMFRDEEIFLALTACEKGLNLEELGQLSERFSPSSRMRLKRFVDALAKIALELPKSGLTLALETFLRDCDYASALGCFDTAMQKWANLEKLSFLLASSHKDPYATIHDLVQRIDNDKKEPLAHGILSDDSVTIMTIHQSKGLEFKVVVLADTESSLPQNTDQFLVDRDFGVVIKPSQRMLLEQSAEATYKSRYGTLIQKHKKKEQEELARLLYVALTRAQNELYVAASPDALAKKPACTLMGLFLRAFHADEQEFLAVCELITVEEPAVCFLQKKRQQSEESVFENPPSQTRLFASELKVHDEELLSQWTTPVRSGPLVDGNSAHKIIANIGALCIQDKADIAQLVDAAQRLLFVSAPAQQTIAAVKKTLNVLKERFFLAEKIIFEMPLCNFVTDNLLIEGFADTVVFFTDFIGVVEFKASARLSSSPQTYMQLLAYAHLLSQQSHKPIKFASHLIGSSSLRWHVYDKDAEQRFKQALRG